MITIVHLYSDLLNLYGDRGNIAALQQRLNWRGIETTVRHIHQNDSLDLNNADIVLLGGGSDASQKIVAHSLVKNKALIQEYIEDNGVFIAVCGGFQLLGTSYQCNDEIIEGMGIFDYQTINEPGRCIGNVVIDSCLGFPIVGFENHGGRTYLTNQKPLGTVCYGFGNDGKGKNEGIIYKNCIGTYIHGPLLPKNPQLCDYLLQAALLRQGITAPLKTLDDTMELKAQTIMIDRAKNEHKDNPYITQ